MTLATLFAPWHLQMDSICSPAIRLGSYTLTLPLNSNGQIDLQVFAAGHMPFRMKLPGEPGVLWRDPGSCRRLQSLLRNTVAMVSAVLVKPTLTVPRIVQRRLRLPTTELSSGLRNCGNGPAVLAKTTSTVPRIVMRRLRQPAISPSAMIDKCSDGRQHRLQTL